MDRTTHRNLMLSLAEQYQSGNVPLIQFCAEHNLKKTTFQYWCSLYRKASANQSIAPAFIRAELPQAATGLKMSIRDIVIDIPTHQLSNPALIKFISEVHARLCLA